MLEAVTEYLHDDTMIVPSFVADNALIIGNGESRNWYKPCHQTILAPSVKTWGCNALYRDGSVDNLVATDHNMEQEIYASGYAKKHTCWFTDWNILPGDVASNVLMGYDIPEEFIFQNSHIGRTSCVIQGKDPALVQEKLNEAIKMNPDMDADDLKMKMEKDVGIWITWVDEDDSVINFDFPRGWSAGNSAMHLACQNTAIKVYLLGFDLSVYGQPLNNVYKGTQNYLPANAIGFNPVNWVEQMQATFVEFRNVQFYWVDTKLKEKIRYSNLEYITKEDLYEDLNIV